MASFELIYLCSMFLTYGKGYHITGPNFPTTSNCPTKSELCHHLIFQSTTVFVIFMTCSPKMIMEFPITCKQMRKNVSKQINRWISFPPFSLNPTSPNSLHDSPRRWADGQHERRRVTLRLEEGKKLSGSWQGSACTANQRSLFHGMWVLLRLNRAPKGEAWCVSLLSTNTRILWQCFC